MRRENSRKIRRTYSSPVNGISHVYTEKRFLLGKWNERKRLMYNLLENVENKKNKRSKKEITKICEDIRINWKKAKTMEKKSDGKFSYFIKMYV